MIKEHETGGCGKAGDKDLKGELGEGMETKCALKAAGDPGGYRQSKIEEQSGKNWVAVPVTEELLPVLQLIVPRGKTSFPCPHLIKDEHGENWLVRPFMCLSETGSENLEKPRILASGSRTVFPKRGQSLKLAAEPALKSRAKQQSGIDNTALVNDAFQLSPKGTNNTSTANPGKIKAIDCLPQAAGKPKNPGMASLVSRKTPVFRGCSFPAPASSFAPRIEKEKPAPAPPPKEIYSQPDKFSAPEEAVAASAETYLAKPAWKRLKAKATKHKTADLDEASGTADIEIFTQPPAAWKLWVRRLLPATSIALLAAGSWQLAGGL